MRVLLAVVMLTGCGRFGFGEHDPSDGGGGEDAASDGPGPLAMPAFCDDRVVTTLPIGAQAAVALRAVALDMKYAVAIETVDQNIPLLELDDDGVLLAMHAPFVGGYAPLYGMSRHNNTPAVSLVTGGTGYIKYVSEDWDGYDTGPSGDAQIIDPAYVQIGASSGIAAFLSGGTFVVGLHDDGDLASIVAASYNPTGVVSGSVVATPGGGRVVVEKAGGVCETFIVTDSNTVTAMHTFSPCYAPKAAAASDTNTIIVHRTDDVGPFAVYVLPSDPTGAGTTIPLTGATHARAAARVDGAVWVGHGSGSYRGLMRFPNGGGMSESRENIPSFYFDLTERDAFWYEGATVHVSTPCLR